MNKDKAGELLGKFWKCHKIDDLDESIYYIDLFIEYLYSEGYEVSLKEFMSNEVDK